MSEILIALAQFVFILWPLFAITALLYSLQVPVVGKKRLKGSLAGLGRRIRRSLLLTWLVLFAAWVVTRFAEGNTPGLLPEPWNTGVFLGGLALLLLSEADELGLFKSRLIARARINRPAGLLELKAMDPYDFEELVAETYRELGYQARQVGQSGDHGVDVLVRTSEGDEWVVQCKRYRDTAGESIIRELYGTMVSEKADRAVLVTTAEITAPARAWARGKPIDLVDGGTLLKMIEKARQRADGTVLDRMAHGLENLLFTSQLPPPALRAAAARTNGSAYGSATASAIGNAAAPTRTVPRAQPPARLPHGVIRYHRGAPVCPNCSMPMLPRPRTAESTRTLYRCRNYPRCRVVLEGIGD